MAYVSLGPLPANRKLSVVMPVYNERTTVEEIVGRVLKAALRLERSVAPNVPRLSGFEAFWILLKYRFTE